MLDMPSAPPAASASTLVTVPAVATTVSDGLGPVLRPGRYRLRIPVWEAPNADEGSAALVVSGAHSLRCSPVDLVPGRVVRVECQAKVSRGTRDGVQVTLVAGGQPVRTWDHQVR